VGRAAKPTGADGLGPGVAGLVALALGAACTAPRPDLIAGDGSLTGDCTPFADLVVEFKPAGGDNDPAAAAAALGPPDDQGVALVADSVLTVRFVGLGAVIEGDGADVGIALVAVPEPGALASGYVSIDGETFEFAGEVGPDGSTLDLAASSLSAASYVRLVGLAGSLAVDAIEAVQTSCPTSAN
jgi:hypothetical protein